MLAGQFSLVLSMMSPLAGIHFVYEIVESFALQRLQLGITDGASVAHDLDRDWSEKISPS